MSRLEYHRRILAGDDNPAVHGAFRNVLAGDVAAFGNQQEITLVCILH